MASTRRYGYCVIAFAALGCRGSVTSQGAKTSGCSTASCGPTGYCAFEPGQECGAAGAPATCKPRPEVCTEEYLPVCGCDGKEYGNACAAARAGFGIRKASACAAQ